MRLNYYRPFGGLYGAPCRWCGFELGEHRPLQHAPGTPQVQTIRPHHWCPTTS